MAVKFFNVRLSQILHKRGLKGSLIEFFLSGVVMCSFVHVLEYGTGILQI
jgi:hypothetical protein